MFVFVTNIISPLLFVILEFFAVNAEVPTSASPDIDWYMKIDLYVSEFPFNFVFVASIVTLFKVTEFLPSTTTPSDEVDVKVASFTVISAVE